MDKRKRKAFFKPIAEEHYARMRFHYGALQRQYIEQLKANSSLEAAGWLDELLTDHDALMGHVAAAAEMDNPAKRTHKTGWKTPAVKRMIVQLALELEFPDKKDSKLVTGVLNTLEAWAEGKDVFSEHPLIAQILDRYEHEDGKPVAELLDELHGGLQEGSLRKSVRRTLVEAAIITKPDENTS